MKKVYILAILAIATFSSFANYGNSRLVIKGADNNNIRILIDGNNFNDKYRSGNSYYIFNINSTNHRIQIIKQRSSIFGRGGEKTIYDQNLFLKSNYETSLTHSSFGNVVVNEIPINVNNNDDINNGNNNGNWNNSQNKSNGRGNKYGHYKKNGKKDKKEKHDRDDDHDDDRKDKKRYNENGNWNGDN